MRKVLLVLFVMLLVTALSAQDMNLALTGNGARSAAMGYAFTAVADDATAMSWNSAGLTQLHSMEAGVVGRFGFGSAEYDGLDNAPDVSYKSKFQLNFLSFAAPLNLSGYDVVAGVAFRNIIDFTNEMTVDYDGIEEIDGSEGGVYAITPAVGVKVNEMLSAGIAFNIYTGSSEGYYEYDDDRIEGGKEDYSGTSLDIGVLVKPNAKVSIGANVNFAYDLKVEGESDDDFDLNRPMFFSIGGAFRATDNLLLAVDYHHQPWSNSETWEDADSEVKDLLDLNSLHFGLEYLMTSGESVLPLRIGYYTKPLFLTWDEDGDQVVNNVFALGAGIVMNNIILDAAFEFEPQTSYAGTDNFGNDVDLKQKLFRFTVGGTFHFGK